MGCSSSSEMKRPNNPLDEMLYQEMQNERRQRQLEKEQKKMKRLQEKNAKKLKKMRENTYPNDIQIRTSQSSKARSSNATIASKTLERKNREKLTQHLLYNVEQKLNKDLCGLALDQITYSIEFFGSFESELTSVLAEFLDKENEYNKNLEDHSILLMNPLDAAVAKWIKYKPIHGPHKSTANPIQATTIYVVFENIDISRPNDANYDSISPLCKVNLETDSFRTTPCKEEHIDILREIKWKGYVRLKLRDDPKNQMPALTRCGRDAETRNIYGTKSMSMASSGYGTEGDYDYVYITQLNTHHPLAELKMPSKSERKQLQAKVLPESCVSYLGAFIDVRAFEGSDDDDFETAEESEDEDVNRDRRKSRAYRDFETTQAIKRYKQEQEKRRQLLQQRYLNSKEFMRYFGELMRQKLAKQLSVSLSELKQATYRGASIYIKDYEIIPAIHVAQNAQSWPECAAQFRMRERPIRKHPMTGQKVQWPTRAMIKQIETFGYHVIPLGYAPKKHRNPFREIEWRIVFPKAERYLERHLSHTQVKVFMIMKALVKTFVEPVETDRALMFAMDNLRTHLFWECERDFTAWPEEFIGDVLLRFIDTFMSRLRQKRLKDYFIEERNLFGSVPEDSLMSLYLILSDIKSNPLMHLLVAFRNLDFNEKFFPKLNFKKIFQNISGEGMVDLKKLSKNSRILVESEDDDYEDDFSGGQTGVLGMGAEKTTGKLRRRTIQLKYEIETQKEEEKKLRGSIESIDVEFFFNNELRSKSNEHINQGVENLRRTNLLEVFLDHYIGVMKKAIKFRNFTLIQGWQAQAERLITFYNNYGCDVGARDYEDSIAMIADIVAEMKMDGELRDDSKIPALPNRMSKSGQNDYKLKSVEVNPYEEVVPVDNNLPPLVNAMKAWESRLQVRHEENNQCGQSTSDSDTLTKSKEITVEVHEYEIDQSVENKEMDEQRSCTLKEEFIKKSHKKLNLRKRTTDDQNDIHENKIKTKAKNSAKLKIMSNDINISLDISSDSAESEKYSRRVSNKKMFKEKFYADLSDDSVYPTNPITKNLRKTDKVNYQETTFIESKKSDNKNERINRKKNDGTLDSDYDSCREVAESLDETSNTPDSSSEESYENEKRKPKPRKSVSFKQNPMKVRKLEIKKAETNQIEINIEENSAEDTDTENSDYDNEKRTSNISFKCLENISFKELEAQVELLNKKDNDSELEAVIVESRTGTPKVSRKKKSPFSRTSNNSIKLNKRNQRQKRESKQIQKSDWETDNSVSTADESEIDIKAKDKINQESEQQASTEPNEPIAQYIAEKPFLGRIINTGELLKYLSVISPSTMETVTESTQKIITTLKSEEKRTQFCDTIKKKTIKLKGALFQSSET